MVNEQVSAVRPLTLLVGGVGGGGVGGGVTVVRHWRIGTGSGRRTRDVGPQILVQVESKERKGELHLQFTLTHKYRIKKKRKHVCSVYAI